LEVVVDRRAAGFAAWYEMFPRSQGSVPGKGATFDNCIARLPEIAQLGFDVVYLVPIHPIGRVNRKGRDNSTVAEPGIRAAPMRSARQRAVTARSIPNSAPWPISAGLYARLQRSGWKSALRFRDPSCADHPWVREHPGMVRFRPDGTIKYAENPPKKYEDIVNIDFDNPDREGCGPNCATRSCSGSTKACAPFASTTRTPNRCRFGSG